MLLLEILNEPEQRRVQSVCDACRDYYIELSGRPAPKDIGVRFFHDLPPGYSASAKLVGLIKQAGNDLGVFEILKHYPFKDAWWLASLMIEGSSRGKGYGAAVVEQLETQAADAGATRMRLLADEDSPASRFWSTLGYAPVMRRPRTMIGSVPHQFVEFEKWLRSS